MKIGIDYTAAIHQQAGIGRYVRDLTGALAALQPDEPFRLFVADGRRVDLPTPPGRCELHPSALSERNHNRLWHRLRLPVPVEMWTGRLDLFHATDFFLPPTQSRTVLTIHDLAFERYPHETMPGMHGLLSMVVPRSVQRADHVIAVSEATKADLVDLYGTPPEKISVVAHGVDPRFRPDQPAEAVAAVRKKYGLPDDAPLVLTVGTMQPRKNHRRLVQAFGRIKERAAVLVIAGGKGWDYEVVEAEAARLGERVVFTGFVDDADLPALYAASAVFAYPALYEGFGLPPLEAMASGVPVLASNTSSLPEVVGGAGLLVDPVDVGEIAAALDNLLGDAVLRDTLRERGIDRAGQFSWARAAESVWGIYRKIVKG